MKKLSVLLIAFIGLTLGSCQFTEEITFKEDGSGTFNVHMDMSKMMSMMNEMDDSSDKNAEKKYEKQDTIVNFSDIIAQHQDSIKNLSEADRTLLESIKDMKMRLYMDEKSGDFFMNFYRDFKNINDLKDMQKQIKAAQALQNKDKSNKAEKDIENHEVKYNFSKNKFTRQVVMLMLSEDEQKQYDEQQEKVKMFTADGLYKIKYTFPKKIKSTSLKGAKISDNGHLLEFEIGMGEILKNPQLLDFEVKF